MPGSLRCLKPMKKAILEHKIGSHSFRLEEIECCLFFTDTGKCSFSDAFPTEIFLGNLQILVYWNLLSLEQELFRKLPEFSSLEPLSYVSIPADQIESVEARLDCEIQISDESLHAGKRHFNWEKFLLLIHEKIFHRSMPDLLVEVKKLFDLKLRQENFHTISKGLEISLNLDSLAYFSTLVQTFFQERQASFQRGSLKFTRQPLDEFGIEFPSGCFYECSGYGIHCFYLADLQTLFLFHTTSAFPVVWYVFLRMLSEMEYFSKDLDSYFNRMEESLRFYPWSEVDFLS